MEETVTVQNKKEYMTLLNVCSAVAVVFLHVNNEAYNSFSANLIYWPIANGIRALLYFAVPIFFMISGANLLDYNLRYSNKEYAIKRIKKAVVPFLFWSFIGFLYFVAVEEPDMEINLASFLNGLINCQYVGTYWFFIPLFLIYLAAPVLALIPQEKKVRAYSYFVVLGFVINMLIPYTINVFHIPIQYYVSFWPVSGYIIYALLGYVLDRSNIDKRARGVIYILGVAGFVMDVVGTFAASAVSGSLNESYSGYLNVPCMMYAAAIFVFFKYVSSKIMSTKKVADFIGAFSGYCFGIYLLHRPILAIIIHLIPTIYYRTGYMLDVFSSGFLAVSGTLIILICIPLIRIIRMIPLLKYTIP